MSTYPTDPAWDFPVTCELTFDTAICTFKDGSEQRHMRDAGKAAWTLTYSMLTLSQRDTLFTFFEDRKGSAGLFDFPFLGTTYTDCYFASDELAFTEEENGFSSATVKIAKVVRTPDATAPATTFPTLTSGNYTQLPYTHSRKFDTVSVLTEGGRSAYSNRSASLRTWSAGGSVLTTTDARAIWNMFSRCQGMYRSFTFTDPDSEDIFTARFGSDTCQWVFSEPGRNQITVTIQELKA